MITRARSELTRYLRTETVGGTLLLVAAGLALLWANSPWSATYQTIIDTELAIPALHLDLTLADWTKDGLLAIFFFVVDLGLSAGVSGILRLAAPGQ